MWNLWIELLDKIEQGKHTMWVWVLIGVVMGVIAQNNGIKTSLRSTNWDSDGRNTYSTMFAIWVTVGLFCRTGAAHRVIAGFCAWRVISDYIYLASTHSLSISSIAITTFFEGVCSWMAVCLMCWFIFQLMIGGSVEAVLRDKTRHIK
ncbi:MAG: hypothetical protein WC794_03195 [Candidatus Doudnabacteria bacterium]|jgi:hypothetical protein